MLTRSGSTKMSRSSVNRASPCAFQCDGTEHGVADAMCFECPQHGLEPLEIHEASLPYVGQSPPPVP